MANKHDYGTKPPNNIQPQREGTPRNSGSPPPDAPIEPFSHPPITQSASAVVPQRPAGQWSPQTNVRPHERFTATPAGPGVGGHGGGSAPMKQGPGPDYPSGSQAHGGKQGMGPDPKPGGGGRTPRATDGNGSRRPLTMGDRPSGTVVPERRSAMAKGKNDMPNGNGDSDCDTGMKDPQAMGGVPGQVGMPIQIPDFSIANPTPTPGAGRGEVGYRPPGRQSRP